MKTFEFKKSYEELQINGEQYKVDMSDRAITDYRKSFENFYERADALQNVDVTNLSEKEEEEYYGKLNTLAKECVEKLLGRNTYEKLYEQSGGSIYNILELIEFLADLIKGKADKIHEENVQKYLRNKK